MKTFVKSITLGFVGVALAVYGFLTPAAAYSPQDGPATSSANSEATFGLTVGQPVIHKRGDGVTPPAELGNPSEWGVVELEFSGSAGAVHPMGNTCQYVTHGTWCYGYDPLTSGKECYSNYSADVQHRTTVRVQNVDYGSGWAAAGDISYAWVDIGYAYTCYAYYDNA